MKSWKKLFVKGEEEEKEKETPSPAPKTGEEFSFPAGNTVTHQAAGNTAAESYMDSSVINEVLQVYEKGVDSINMPGYDFYEFYKAISTISNAGEQAYQMAYQMAKSMDSGLTSSKLLKDAEFYISKINEVHGQYTMQGQQKLNQLDAKKGEEKNKLTQEIQTASQQVNQLRNQLLALEAEINKKQTRLTLVDGEYLPQENAIRQKLMANDQAKQISVSRLTNIKEGIQKFIK
jgi:hypothetical protein